MCELYPRTIIELAGSVQASSLSLLFPYSFQNSFTSNHSTPSPLHIFTHHNLTSWYPCTRASSFNYLPSDISKYSQHRHGYTCKVNQGDILHPSPAPSKTYKNLLTCSRASSQPHQSCAAILHSYGNATAHVVSGLQIALWPPSVSPPFDRQIRTHV